MRVLLITSSPALVFALALAFIGAFAITASPARADVLHLKDGRVVEGVVQLRDKDAVVLSRFGTAVVPRDQITKHVKGPSVDQQLQTLMKTLGSEDTDGRIQLATWLRDLGRAVEADALANGVLDIDPEHAGAHTLLGNERFRGRWMTPDAAKRAQGLEQHGDTWYTPAEWKIADPKRKAAAAARDVKLMQAARKAQVTRLIELLVSPDPALRKRARRQLRALAAERGIDKARVNQAIAAAAAYVLRLDDAMLRAGAGGAAGGTKFDRHGWMLADVHDDFVRLKRPIREFATTLASSSAPVVIQLPEVRVVRVRTTTAVPLVPSLRPSR